MALRTGGQGQALLAWGQAGHGGAGNVRAEGLREVQVGALALQRKKREEGTEVSLTRAQKAAVPAQGGVGTSVTTEWAWMTLFLSPGNSPPSSTLLLDSVLEAEVGLVWGPPNDLSPQFLEPVALALYLAEGTLWPT